MVIDEPWIKKNQMSVAVLITVTPKSMPLAFYTDPSHGSMELAVGEQVCAVNRIKFYGFSRFDQEASPSDLAAVSAIPANGRETIGFDADCTHPPRVGDKVRLRGVMPSFSAGDITLLTIDAAAPPIGTSLDAD